MFDTLRSLFLSLHAYYLSKNYKDATARTLAKTALNTLASDSLRHLSDDALAMVVA